MGRKTRGARIVWAVSLINTLLASTLVLTGVALAQTAEINSPEAMLSETPESDATSTGASKERGEDAKDRPLADARPRIRIGALIRQDFSSCIEAWTPLADYLSQQVPEYRFVIQPLASRDDVQRVIQGKEQVAFLITNPEIYLAAEKNWGAVAIASMLNQTADGATPTYSGSLIARAGAAGLTEACHMKGRSIVASRDTSFGGWGMQEAMLIKSCLHPGRELMTPQFVGSPANVVETVAQGKADIGAIDTDLLENLIAQGRVDRNQVIVLHRDGKWGPPKEPLIGATPSYPSWVFAKTSATDNQLASDVTQKLLAFKTTPDPSRAENPRFVGWTVPQDYRSVAEAAATIEREKELTQRTLLESMVQGDTTAGRRAGMLLLLAFAAATVFCMFRLSQVRRERNQFESRIVEIGEEIDETRAEKHHVEAILAATRIGVDIIDKENNLRYVDIGLEKKYGDWRGMKCDDYFKHGDKATVAQHRELALANGHSVYMEVRSDGDTPYYIIGVPFHDENGRSMVARVHLDAALVDHLVEKADAEPVGG